MNRANFDANLHLNIIIYKHFLEMVERSGEIVLLREMHEDANVIGKTLRITGFVRHVDVSQSIICIEHGDKSVYVDTSLVPASSIELESLVQFLGEVKPACDHPYFARNIPKTLFFLKAKVFRVVDGLDLALYTESLLMRREFLQRRGDQQKALASGPLH